MPRLATVMLATIFLAMGLGVTMTDAAEVAPAYSHTDRLIVRFKRPSPAHTEFAATGQAAVRHANAARLQPLTSEVITPLRTMGDGAEIVRLNRRMPLQQIRQIAASLAKHPDVMEVQPDRLFFPQLTPTDQLYANQWNLTQASGINLPGAWDITTGSNSLVIAILDTGMLPHTDLIGRWTAGYDFVSLAERGNDGNLRDGDPADPGDWVTAAESASGPLVGCPVTDSRWHGTAMAGIIAATGNNGQGIAGVNWQSKILPVRVVGKCGGYESDIIDGMRWAAGMSVPGIPVNPNKALLLNISLAAIGSCNAALQSAIDDVTKKGAAVIVAAGNNSAPAGNYSPGNCSGVITLGAVDRNGGLPPYANTGASIVLSAPGGTGTGSTAITTTMDSGTTTPLNDSSYAGRTGTSISAAHATGVASLMLSVNPSLLPLQVKDILAYTARSFPNAVALGSPANCNQALCGAGIVNAVPAMWSAQSFGAGGPSLQVSGTALGEAIVGLRSDGAILEWGSQWPLTSTPVLRGDIGDVRRIARSGSGSGGHTLALRIDGSLWVWGGNTQGQLGISNTLDAATPVPVTGIAGVTAVDAGYRHSVARRIDGTVSTWGDNQFGQLGDGTTINRLIPTTVPGLASVVSIAAGHEYTLALKSDGTVWAWGNNTYNQLGDGSIINRLTPVAVAGLGNVTAIAAGTSHSLAVKSDGTVWAWGYNNQGQLGDGTLINRLTPVAVTGLSNVVAVAGGTYHSLALKSDGTVWGWGSNAQGQLGDGTTISRSVPAAVPGLNGVAALGKGWYDSFAIKSDGSVLAWGYNYDGGVVGPIGMVLQPTPVMGTFGPGSHLNLNLNAPGFTPQLSVAQSSVRVSNTIAISGIANGSAISISGGEYQVDGGTFITVAGTINDGQLLTVRQTASANCGTTTTATVTVAGITRNFAVITLACDTVPNALAALSTQANAVAGSVRTSNTITVSGINGAIAISITGGTYSIGCTATFTAAASTIDNNQTVCVRQTASASPDTVTTAVLTVGPVSTAFRVITAAGLAFTTTPQVMGTSWQGTHLGLRNDGLVFEWGAAPLPATPALRTDISGVKKLALGGDTNRYALALRADGTVWAWGSNAQGQLGIGTTTAAATAVPVTALSGVTAIAAGDSHSLALKSDGTVWAWGDNAYFQLGDGTSSGRLSPVQIAGLSGVVAIAAGGLHSLAIKSDGTLWAWGYNAYGQLGDGSTTSRNTPVQVSVLSNVVSIAAGYYHSLALTGNARVSAWGYNSYGQLGDGTTVNRSTPVQLATLLNIVSIAAGNSHSLARKSDNTVSTWGRNNYGQLGDGTTADRLAPVSLSTPTGVALLGVGPQHSFAMKVDGSVFAWGESGLGTGVMGNQLVAAPVYGQTGAGSIFNFYYIGAAFASHDNVALSSLRTSNPVAITAIASGSPITVSGGEYQIDSGPFTSAGGTINPGQTLTLRQTAPAICASTTVATVTIAAAPRTFIVSTIVCDATPDPLPAFGTQANVPTGSVRTSNTITVTGFNSTAPVSVAGGTHSIGCTGTFTAAVGTIVNNQTICVRQTAAATLDTVTTTTLTVGSLSTAFRVITAAGAAFTSAPQALGGYFVAPHFALRSDGLVFEWGASPLTPTPAPRADISGVKRLAMGRVTAWHALALRADGIVWSWGSNSQGQLGNATTSNATTAAPVLVLTGATAIAVGAEHSLAVKNDGTAWAWGNNAYGQLGDGTMNTRLAPVQVSGLTAASSVAAGEIHTLVQKTDGTVWAWGNNVAGQLGDGTTTTRNTPVQVSGLTGIVAIAAGQYYSLALKSGGTVWAWGNNIYGQLGDGTTTSRTLPVQVAGLTNVTAIATGHNHSLALKGDGTVWAWGFNFAGQLGDGTSTSRSTPVMVSGLSGVAALGSGTFLSFAIKTDGSVVAWGENSSLTEVFGAVWQPAPVLGPTGPGSVLNLNLNAAGFTSQSGVTQTSVRTSNTIAINGIANGSAISVSGGAYQLDSGAFTSVAGTINAGQWVTLRQTASANCGSTTVATVTIGGVARSFSVTTIACDNIPNALAPLAAQGNVPLNSVRTSNTITVSDINAPIAISVTGGTYSIGCTTLFTAVAGTIGNNQTVCVRQTASASLDTVTTAILTVGPLSTAFRAITTAGPAFTTTPQAMGAEGETAHMGLRSDGLIFEWGGPPPMTSLPSQRGDISGVKKLAEARSASGVHMLALRADGTVWGWGNNGKGQLGNGTTISAATAVPVPGLSGMVAVAAGSYHSLALKNDGTVWAWGDNDYNQLGDGTSTDRLTPVQVAGLTGVTAIASGELHALAIRSDGTVWAWGYNNYGQLGIGTTMQPNAPMQVTGLTNTVAVSVGLYHSLAVKTDGTVWAWGNNNINYGQVGDGTLMDRWTPVQVPGLVNVTSIAAGAYHSLAQKSDGTVWAWGGNLRGPIGDGTTIDRIAPVPIVSLSNVGWLGVGTDHSYAILQDGSLLAWGDASGGGLTGTVDNVLLPTAVRGVGGFGTLDLIVDGLTPNPFNFAPSYGEPVSSQITSNLIIVSGLGSGVSSPITVANGQISINGGLFTTTAGSISNGDTLRMRVLSPSGYETLVSATVTIGGAVGYSTTFHVYTRRDPARPPATPYAALGASHSILLNARGNVFGFGYNGNGQLGNGANFSTAVPAPVAGVAGIVQIASGANHVLALTASGVIKAWGYNAAGQLGNGGSANFSLNAVTVSGLSFVKSIAAGRDHSLALKADGTVWAWGLNVEGQLGDGSTAATRPTPVQVPGLNNVIAIAAGDRHSLALLSSGQVMAWGANDTGQLGDGTAILRRSPTTIPSFSGVVSVAAGSSHSLAIRNDGTAWAWGGNGFGQLGIGSNSNRASPVQITALGNSVGLIAAGDSHSIAVKSGGAMFTWGANQNGQLGDGTSTSRDAPIEVSAPVNVVAISGGSRHSAAMNNAGKLFVWGDNYFGQVGNKSGNFNPQLGALNVLQGASQISTYAQAAGSSTGTASSAGSAVIEIAEIATGYDFKTLTLGSSGAALGKFKNQALTDEISSIGLNVSGPGFSLQSTDCTPILLAGTECNFAIGFAPALAGDAIGELQVASSLIGSPERRSLVGTGVPPATPGLKVDATAGESYLAFSPQSVGTASAAANVTITNTGTAPLVVSSTAVTAGGSDFSVAGTCTTTVMAGAICTLPVTFTPSHASSIEGQLTLITNAGTQVVALSGTGVGTGIGGGLILNAVYSRKIHGAAGPFNLVIDTSRQINQPVTVEPRSGAAGHLIVFLFNQPIAQPGTVAAVDAMNAPVGNITGFSIQGSEVHVALSGVPDNKRLTLSLAGVNGSGSAQVSIGFMIGDTNSSGGVNAADICSIKARSGQAVNAATARFDLNLSGTISSQDVSMVKTRAGWRLP